MRAKIRLMFVAFIVFSNFESKKAYSISDESSEEISRDKDLEEGLPPDKDSKGIPLPYGGLDLTKQDTSELFQHYLKAAKIEDRVREIDNLDEKAIDELAKTLPQDSSELHRQYVEAEKNADHAREGNQNEEATEALFPDSSDLSD